MINTVLGFSKYFAQPSYQQDVVANYLRIIGGSIPHNYYNVSNRAYPDVSASAHNYLVQVSGVWDPVDGTSASTPTVAGLISIANDYRIQHGKPPLGFVVIYAITIIDLVQIHKSAAIPRRLQL